VGRLAGPAAKMTGCIDGMLRWPWTKDTTALTPKKAQEGDPLIATPATQGSSQQKTWLGKFSLEDIRVIAIILVEMGLSIALNFYNSYLLKHVPGFNFPLIYTAVHMFTSLIGASVLIWCAGAATVSFAQLRDNFPQIALLAVLRGASITTNNWSLQYMDLALNKVIKASAPIFTVLLSILCERKSYSWPKLVTLAVLAVGTMLSCVAFDSSIERDTRGTLLALSSAVVGGCSLVVSALLLGKGSAGMSAITLLFYFSPLQFVLLSVLVPFTEWNAFREWSKDQAGSAVGYIAIGAVLAFCFNMMGFVLVRTTSSVTTAMIGNLKIVIVIVVASVLMGSQAEPINIIGYVVTIIAACSYTGVNLHESGKLRTQSPADAAGSAPANQSKSAPPPDDKSRNC